jgi:lipase
MFSRSLLAATQVIVSTTAVESPLIKRFIAEDGITLGGYLFSSLHPPLMTPLPPLVFCHATGFHARVFDTTIKNLLNHSFDCMSLDLRGHGSSSISSSNSTKTTPLEWDQFGKDVALFTEQHFMHSKLPVIGVGHSAGASACLSAYLQNPKLFSALILFEPVVYIPDWRKIPGPHHLSVLAQKRRRFFQSEEEALTNFSSKLPMKLFHSEVLRDYVVHGLCPSSDVRDQEDCFVTSPLPESSKKLTLRCKPEFEASVYDAASRHLLYEKLNEVSIPVLIISGRVESRQISEITETITDRIPKGKYELWNDASHFGPLEMPHRLADSIRSFVKSLRS